MTSPVNRLNLVQGPLRLYYAPWADVDTEPTDPANIGTTPAAPFVYLGATRGGVNLVLEQTYANLEVDQALGVADVRLTGETVRLVGTLAEPTLDNLKRHLNSGSVAAGVFTPRGTDAVANAIPANGKLIVDGLAPGGVNLRRRAILRRVVNTDGASLAGSKTDAQGLSVSFLALIVDEDPAYSIEDAQPA